MTLPIKIIVEFFGRVENTRYYEIEFMISASDQSTLVAYLRADSIGNSTIIELTESGFGRLDAEHRGEVLVSNVLFGVAGNGERQRLSRGVVDRRHFAIS